VIMRTVVIDPVTRIEGHLKVEAVIDGGEVKEARSSGTLFRGIELILQGRDPRDASRITQRICGVCPTAHATASTFALDEAFEIADRIPENGRILRNLILGCNFIQSHVLHFYHLAALDYVDITEAGDYAGTDPGLLAAKGFLERGALGPFVPRYEGDYRLPKEISQQLAAHYVQAFDARRKAHELLALFGGKMPHNVGIVPGGVTQRPHVDIITAFLWRLNELRHFIDYTYLPDVLEVARHYSDYAEIGSGCGEFISYGGFPQSSGRFLPMGTIGSDLTPAELDADRITESVAHSWFANGADPLHPNHGETVPNATKETAYSWIKAPRYAGRVHEGGPLARMLLGYAHGHEAVKSLIDPILEALDLSPLALNSVLGRHAARAAETKIVADAMAEWVLELAPGEPVYASYEIPDEGEGMGLVAAPRGALGHWVQINGKKISHYQCVVPTTWNASPKDDNGNPGPIEQAILGTRIRDEENPFEIVRIVRSFDPCLACAVHVMTPGREALQRFVVS
jgi:hydrogenase large subunit